MATSPTEPDVVDVRTTDHREVSALIAEIWASDDAGRRRDLADTITSDLVRHAIAEEMYVYPAMREHLPDGDGAVEHDTAEHKQVERILKDLEGVAGDDPQFTALMRALEEVLADHIQEEEADQFPQLRARVPREELVAIARQSGDGEEDRADSATPLRAEQRRVPQAGRSGCRPGRPVARQAFRAFLTSAAALAATAPGRLTSSPWLTTESRCSGIWQPRSRRVGNSVRRTRPSLSSRSVIASMRRFSNASKPG